MCTLSFQPNAQGFFLAMNRDEQRSRGLARPPEISLLSHVRALYPREPGGGTWIGVNSSGLVFALLNWYEKTQTSSIPVKSRGEIIPALLRWEDHREVCQVMDAWPASAFSPFRLIMLEALSPALLEWRWDGLTLEKIEHPWKARHWFSSGFDEPTAVREREKVVLQARQEADAGTLPWLRRLHQSHAPEVGPNSVCMHRQDAVTVSFTEMSVTPQGSEMRYQPGSPCEANAPFLHQLDFGSSPQRS